MRWTVVTMCLLAQLFCSAGERQVCDSEVLLDSTTQVHYSIYSTGYPHDFYVPGLPYSWCISSPNNTAISIYCKHLDIPKSAGCKTDALIVSYDDESRSLCGSKSFNISSDTNNMRITLHSNKKSQGGQFSCQIEAEKPKHLELSTRAIVYDQCDCGYSYKLRIVGGRETGINEFPFMAGLVDARRGAVIVCGAAIIGERHVLTADHCLSALVVDKTGVVVGEHNVSTGAETSVTKLIRAKRFIKYPYYDSSTQQYDLALIELVTPITYSMRVGPVCLPFMSRNWDLTGELVTVLGWGTTEFGGPRSKVLKKTNLNLMNIQNCVNSYGSNIEPNTQLCTYSANTDACQYDSGGPLVWFNYYTNRYEIVGLISYGRGCAQPNTPSVNTYVAPFLQWVLDNTQSETYCYKSQS